MSLASLERLQVHTNELALLKRRHNIAGYDDKEDDIAHSYAVAMWAWQLNDNLEVGLDNEKILRYALIHDFVEVYAGDVNSFASPDVRAQKQRDEELALDRLRAEYADSPSFISAIEAYERRSDEEAQFVWSCDKMQALLQGQLDHWRCYYELKITDEQFAAKMRENRPRIHPALLDFYDDFCIDCVSSYRYVEPQETLF